MEITEPMRQVYLEAALFRAAYADHLDYRYAEPGSGLVLDAIDWLAEDMRREALVVTRYYPAYRAGSRSDKEPLHDWDGPLLTLYDVQGYRWQWIVRADGELQFLGATDEPLCSSCHSHPGEGAEYEGPYVPATWDHPEEGGVSGCPECCDVLVDELERGAYHRRGRKGWRP